jgi:hypothetical protein
MDEPDLERPRRDTVSDGPDMEMVPLMRSKSWRRLPSRKRRARREKTSKPANSKRCWWFMVALCIGFLLIIQMLGVKLAQREFWKGVRTLVAPYCDAQGWVSNTVEERRGKVFELVEYVTQLFGEDDVPLVYIEGGLLSVVRWFGGVCISVCV